MNVEQVILGAFWVLAAFMFVGNSDLLTKPDPRRWSASLLWIVLIFLLLAFFFDWRRLDRFFAIIFPVIFSGLGFARLIRLARAYTLRFSFCALACAIFIGVYQFVLYFEPVDGLVFPYNFDMLHRRYLEYFRSMIWLVITGTVGYLAWELNWDKERLPRSKEASQAPAILGLFQLAVVFIGGIIVTAYAFIVKLSAMERISTVVGTGW